MPSEETALSGSHLVLSACSGLEVYFATLEEDEEDDEEVDRKIRGGRGGMIHTACMTK